MEQNKEEQMDQLFSQHEENLNKEKEIEQVTIQEFEEEHVQPYDETFGPQGYDEIVIDPTQYDDEMVDYLIEEEKQYKQFTDEEADYLIQEEEHYAKQDAEDEKLRLELEALGKEHDIANFNEHVDAEIAKLFEKHGESWDELSNIEVPIYKEDGDKETQTSASFSILENSPVNTLDYQGLQVTVQGEDYDKVESLVSELKTYLTLRRFVSSIISFIKF